MLEVSEKARENERRGDKGYAEVTARNAFDAVERTWIPADKIHAHAMTRKTMLFLCTGNYYRSRFAELLFNHLAAETRLDWLATSRALPLERGDNNVGSISQYALTGLSARGIALKTEFRNPTALSAGDLEKAHYIIAVNRAEHLPLLERKFPYYVNHVEFWDVHDVDLTVPAEALAQLERNVLELMTREPIRQVEA